MSESKAQISKFLDILDIYGPYRDGERASGERVDWKTASEVVAERGSTAGGGFDGGAGVGVVLT